MRVPKSPCCRRLPRSRSGSRCSDISLATPAVPHSANEALNVAIESWDKMTRVPTLLTVLTLMACCAPLLSAAAQAASHTPVKPKSAQGHKAPMRHDQLTLYPHGKPARRQSAHGHPPPIRSPNP